MSEKSPNLVANLQPGFLPLNRAATWAGISVKTLRRWMARGLPWYQAGPGEKVLIRPCDVEAFLTRRQVLRTDLDAIVDGTLRELTGKEG